MMTRDEFFRDYIATWEGGLSLDPDDRGNWYSADGQTPILAGSNHGVTAATLAAWRGTSDIAMGEIAALTLSEAVRIAEALYYEQPGFASLPWDPLIASVVDFGWGAGPGQAIRLLQRLTGTAEDGVIGAATAAAYAAYLSKHGLEQAARAWLSMRKGFYRTLVQRRPVDAKYLRGWLRRSDYYAPGGAWWRRFMGQAMA